MESILNDKFDPNAEFFFSPRQKVNYTKVVHLFLSQGHQCESLSLG